MAELCIILNLFCLWYGKECAMQISFEKIQLNDPERARECILECRSDYVKIVNYAAYSLVLVWLYRLFVINVFLQTAECICFLSLRECCMFAIKTADTKLFGHRLNVNTWSDPESIGPAKVLDFCMKVFICIVLFHTGVYTVQYFFKA